MSQSNLPPLPSASSEAKAVATVPASPAVAAGSANRQDYTIESKAFRDKVTRLQKAFRDIMSIGKAVYSTEKGGKISYTDGEVGRKQLNSYISAFANELEVLGKNFTASVGRGKTKTKKATTAGRGAQLRSLFYLSEPLVSYLNIENYGNGLAAAFNVNDNVDASAVMQNYNGHAGNALRTLQDYLGKVTGTTVDDNVILTRLQEAENATAKAAGRAASRVDASYLSGIDVTESLDLVLNKRMATSGILISLFSLIDRVNNLQSKSNGQRNHYNDAMEAYFDGYRKTLDEKGNWVYQTSDGRAPDLTNATNLIPNTTRWVMLRGNDLVDVTPSSDAKGRVYVTPTPDVAARVQQLQNAGKDDEADKLLTFIAVKEPAKFLAKLRDVNKSAFQRLRERGSTAIRRAQTIDNPTGEVKVPSFIDKGKEQKNTDDWGMLHSMFMVLISYFRIPNELLMGQELTAIKSVVSADGKSETNANIDEAARLQSYIHGLSEIHKARTEPAKKQARNKKRIESQARKKASQPAKTKKMASGIVGAGLAPIQAMGSVN